MDSSPYLDIGKLARSLPGGSKYRERFKAAVNAARGAMAEVLDLLEAERCITELVKIDAEASGDVAPQSAHQTTRARALYVCAIVTYIRATERRSDNKPKPDYEMHYTTQQAEDHKYIMHLRDDALAHWGPGPDLAGEPHHNITIAAKGASAHAVFTTANYRGATVRKLSALVDTAIPAATYKEVELRQTALEAYDALVAAEPDLTAPLLDLNTYRQPGSGLPSSHMRKPASGG